MKFNNCQDMVRKEEVPIDFVLSNIAHDRRSENAKMLIGGDMIKMFSDRYKVFKKSTKCCTCGIEAVTFVKCKNAADAVFHLNLYAVDHDGEAVLMTKDHIIPKSRGGMNTFSNYQTMCSPCNSNKGATL